ncbi:recombinase family protein [Clostridium estertheticum]|uniref:recombinase family protein n=1 Tax=Clostridium estertheticum TaxID=238834 RepID=UPI001C0E8237|nr:recombinase family protein [Clostridium estertheticum]MBU3072844.1 recombinase family protein [Clostridium estertheticum]MBU3163119.1 recombinase family protein [Clostridium estertheticum]
MKDRDGKFIIKSVAVYLRKSRSESEKDLDNHRNTLVGVCIRQGWEYNLFEEIASGESLEMRPEAQKLLKYIEEELYDAVVVMDIDRLSRSGNSEFENIKKILIDSNTMLVIKDRALDLANAQDDMTYRHLLQS